MMLACLAGAGLIMGFYFNAYALLASCLVVAVAAMVSTIEVGIAQAGISLIVGLIVIQATYAVGLLASSLLSASTRASLPTARLRE